MLNNKFKHQSGLSQLLLILIVASVIAFIILAIQIISLLQAKQAATLISTQQTYFAAEGALFETLEHLRNDDTWPAPLPYEDNYKIDPQDPTACGLTKEQFEEGKAKKLPSAILAEDQVIDQGAAAVAEAERLLGTRAAADPGLRPIEAEHWDSGETAETGGTGPEPVDQEPGGEAEI